jgi:hypothetical protein
VHETNLKGTSPFVFSVMFLSAVSIFIGHKVISNAFSYRKSNSSIPIANIDDCSNLIGKVSFIGMTFSYVTTWIDSALKKSMIIEATIVQTRAQISMDKLAKGKDLY